MTAITTGPGLGKCAICLDGALTANPALSVIELMHVDEAIVLVTVLQPFPQPGGQQVMAPVQMGVCLAHRKAQLGSVASRTGLLTG